MNPPQAVFAAQQGPDQITQARFAAAYRRVTDTRRDRVGIVRPPAVVTPAAVFIAPPIQTETFAAQERLRAHKRRFPLQGWEGWGAVDRLFGTTNVNPDRADTVSATQVGNTTTQQQVAESFVMPANGQNDAITVFLAKAGSPADNFVLELRTDSAGTPSNTVLGSVSVPGASVSSNTTTPTIVSLTSAVYLTAGTTYWIVARRDGVLSDTNLYRIVSFRSAGTNFAFNGTSWSLLSSPGFYYSFAYESLTPSQSFHGYQRFLGPRPPLIIRPLPNNPPISVTNAIGLLTRQRRNRQRIPFTVLFGFIPQVSAQPPPLAVYCVSPDRRIRLRATQGYILPPVVTFDAFTPSGPETPRVHTRPRRTRALIATPRVVGTGQVFYGPSTYSVAVAATRRRRRELATYGLAAPSVIDTTETLFATAHLFATVRTRPRTTRSFWIRPATTPRAAVFYGPIVKTVRNRPRRTHSSIYRPTALRTFAGPDVTITRTRPRRTHWLVAPPATLEPESVQIAERTISVHLVRTRPRHTLGTRLSYVVYRATSEITVANVRTRPRRTHSFLTAVSYPATSEISTRLVQTRPRRIHSFLRPPTVLQTFAGPVEEQIAVKIPLEDRRRSPHSELRPPTVVIPVGQIYYGPAVLLRRIRPRPTTRTLGEPQTLQVFAGPEATLTRTRPRRTFGLLIPPATLEAESIQDTERRIRVALVETRPRPIGSFLYPPTVVRVPSVEQEEQTIRTALVRTRPRPFRASIFPPTVLQVFTGPAVTLTRIRPRPFKATITPPTVVRVPSVEQQEQTVRVALVETRPRPTTTALRPPTVIVINPPVVTEILTVQVALRTRIEQKRHVVEHFLRPPQKVVPLPTLEMQTVKTHLRRIRPPRTAEQLGSTVRPPTVLRVFSGPDVTLTRIRPRPTHAFLTNIAPRRATSEILVLLTRTRPRPTQVNVFPPTLVQARQPDYGQQVIRVLNTVTRPRPTHVNVEPPMRLHSFVPGPRVTTVETRPRPTTSFLRPPQVVRVPSVEQARRTITVKLARIRPQPTIARVEPPTVLSPVVTTIKAVPAAAVPPRFRPVRSSLKPGVVSEPPVVTTITTKLVQTRPQPTEVFVTPPTIILPLPTQQMQTILVKSVRIRPVPYSATVNPPTVVVTEIPGVVCAEDLPGTASAADSIAGSDVCGENTPESTSQAEDTAAVTSTLEDIPEATVETHDEQAGT